MPGAKLNRVDGYNLLHAGAVALSEVEANGIRLDVPYLQRTTAEVAAKIKQIEDKLRGAEEYRLQRRRYGQNCNLGSREQLAAVLFKDMGHKPLNYTAGSAMAVREEDKVPQLDEVQLKKIGTPYCCDYIELEKLNKLHGTYLTGMLREVENGRVHAFFGLNGVRSYRSQSDSPNLQNIPIRDKNIGPLIRRAFIASVGHQIVEMDYSGAEVRVACSLSGDEKLTYDVLQGDMHRDMAAECFMLPKEEVQKPVRQTAKGGFVFAEFYGDWYKQVCKNLWDDIEQYKLTTKDGVGLYAHLASKGITVRGECDSNAGDPRKGTFEAHIKEVEYNFWNRRFKVYHAKRKAWHEAYKRLGYIDLATGFRCMGPMSKNQVINYPIQGPAFHCLLWSLIKINAEVKRRGMRAMIIGQIHDSLLADVPNEEVDDYIAMARDIATTKLQAHWPWITVPMDVEVEVSATNWHEKKKYEVKHGV